MAEKKLTTDEMDTISTLQQKNQTKIVEFGQIRMELLMTRKRLEQLDDLEAKLEDEVLTLQKEEQEFISSLTTKYGVGNLDLQNGVFVSVDATETVEK